VVVSKCLNNEIRLTYNNQIDKILKTFESFKDVRKYIE